MVELQQSKFLKKKTTAANVRTLNLERNQERHELEKNLKYNAMIETTERVLKLDFINSTKEIIFSSGKLKAVLKEIAPGSTPDKITQYDAKKKLFKRVPKHHLKMLFDFDIEAIALLSEYQLI